MGEQRRSLGCHITPRTPLDALVLIVISIQMSIRLFKCCSIVIFLDMSMMCAISTERFNQNDADRSACCRISRSPGIRAPYSGYQLGICKGHFDHVSLPQVHVLDAYVCMSC